MNEITIAVKYDNDNPTVSGQELHKALMIDTPHKRWFDRMSDYGFKEGKDFWTFCPKVQAADRQPIISSPLTWQSSSV